MKHGCFGLRAEIIGFINSVLGTLSILFCVRFFFFKKLYTKLIRESRKLFTY